MIVKKFRIIINFETEEYDSRYSAQRLLIIEIDSATLMAAGAGAAVI